MTKKQDATQKLEAAHDSYAQTMKTARPILNPSAIESAVYYATKTGNILYYAEQGRAPIAEIEEATELYQKATQHLENAINVRAYKMDAGELFAVCPQSHFIYRLRDGAVIAERSSAEDSAKFPYAERGDALRKICRAMNRAKLDI